MNKKNPSPPEQTKAEGAPFGPPPFPDRSPADDSPRPAATLAGLGHATLQALTSNVRKHKLIRENMEQSVIVKPMEEAARQEALRKRGKPAADGEK